MMAREQALRRLMRSLRLSPHPTPLAVTTKNLTRRGNGPQGGAIVKCAPNPFDRGLEREARALETIRELAANAIRVPKVLAFDATLQVLALEWIDDAATLYDRRRARTAELPTFERLGRALGALHAQTSGQPAPDWARPPDETVLDCFIWTRPEFATRLSIDGMRLIGSIQGDPPARAGLLTLAAAPKQCLIHGDAKMLNVLVSADGDPILLDWELTQWGDPAQDLGSLLGDLTRCHVAPESEDEHLDARELAQIRRAVMRGYRSTARVDADLETRVKLWTGAHLLFYAHMLVLADGVYSDLAATLLQAARELLVTA